MAEMKVLHIFKEKPDYIVRGIIEEQKKYAEVTEFFLYETEGAPTVTSINDNSAMNRYEKLIELIEKVDKLFTW
jgi:hypothetical protein